MDLQHSRLHVLVGRSQRLRRELLDVISKEWTGNVARAVEPKDIQDILLAADTPSLFGDATLTMIVAGEQYIAKHATLLKDHLGMPASNGLVILHSEKIPPKGGVRQAAQKANALLKCDEPGTKPREMEPWLKRRLDEVGCDASQMVAKALLHHRGADLDALLSSIDVLQNHAGDERIGIKDVHAVISGQTEEPLYKFADAFFSGDARAAINLMHAGRGLEPQQSINAIINELRKLLCAAEFADPEDIAYHAGLRYALNDYAANAIRKRALGMGKRCLLRLVSGLQQAQRDLRRTGTEPVLVMETLILNASRVIRSMS